MRLLLAEQQEGQGKGELMRLMMFFCFVFCWRTVAERRGLCVRPHLFAPVTIIFPVLKTSAVVCGERNRMVTAEKRWVGVGGQSRNETVRMVGGLKGE